MGALTDLLRQNPGCRVTVHFGPSRRKAQAGDVKTARGKKYVRQQQFSTFDRAYMVNGRGPMWEWVLVGSENDRQSPHYSGQDYTRSKTATQPHATGKGGRN